MVDQVITVLRRRLEVMESFHRSSSSFDALAGDLEGRSRSGGVVLLAEENESIASPAFRPLSQDHLRKTSESSRPRFRSHTDNQHNLQQHLPSPTQSLASNGSSRSSRLHSFSAAILPSFKQRKTEGTRGAHSQ